MARVAGSLPPDWVYRLPTEAEWEYACRAGSTGTLYEGELVAERTGYNAPEVDALAWYGGNSCKDYPEGLAGWPCDTWENKQYNGKRAGPRQVAGKRPNAWGLYDMLGNLQEWTASFSGDSLTLQRVNPDLATGTLAVYRGGAWNTFGLGCRNSSRSDSFPENRSIHIGFRVVLARALQ